jgi:hypothetical protein
MLVTVEGISFLSARGFQAASISASLAFTSGFTASAARKIALT